MSFIDEVKAMPFNVIKKAEFRARKMTITFRSGNEISATCPDGNDNYEILQKELLEKLGPEKVIIHGD